MVALRRRLPWARLIASFLGLVVVVSSALAPAVAAGGAKKRWDPIRVAPVRLSHPGVLITPGANVPNPFITKFHGRYLMFASQDVVFIPIDLLVSKSLTRWRDKLLDPFPNLPRWAETNFTWSPDVRELDGRYVMWFSAARATTSAAPTKCIGVATARSIFGPYVSRERRPLICQLSHYGSIDPRTFRDPSGRLWLLWKSDDNARWTASTRTVIYSQQLSADGLRLVGKRHALLSADQSWENGIIEAPDLVFAAGRYWLFFSGNWFNEPHYGIGLAQCAGPAGPCRPSTAGPWLSSNAQGKGPGEETLFYDGARWWLLYAPSAVRYQTYTNRPAALARLLFTRKGPKVVRPGTKAWSRPVALPRRPPPGLHGHFFLGR